MTEGEVAATVVVTGPERLEDYGGVFLFTATAPVDDQTRMFFRWTTSDPLGNSKAHRRSVDELVRAVMAAKAGQ